MVTTIRVTDTATRADIEQAIKVLRARAVRLPRVSRKRDEIDAEVEALVDMWLEAER